MKKKSFHQAGTRFPEENRVRRKFGQNFLIDQAIIEELADDIPLNSRDWVIEIGPGKGALTNEISSRCRNILAIEKDPKWVGYLQTKSGISNLEVMQADASMVELHPLLKGKPSPAVIGNLPYNRAAPILFHFLKAIRQFQFLYFMVQYEVAKRICAHPGTRDYGQMSVLIQNQSKPEMRVKILPEAFRPKPKVWSATVLLRPLQSPHCEDPAFPFFVSTAFSQKRKQLTNTLNGIYPRDKIFSSLESLGLNERSRPEELSVTQYKELFQSLGPIQKPGV